MYKYRQIDFKLYLKCKKWRSNIGGCLLIIIPLKKMPLGVFKERLLAKRSPQQTFTNVYIIVRKAIVSCDNPWVAHMDGLPDFTSSHLDYLESVGQEHIITHGNDFQNHRICEISGISQVFPHNIWPFFFCPIRKYLPREKNNYLFHIHKLPKGTSFKITASFCLMIFSFNEALILFFFFSLEKRIS